MMAEVTQDAYVAIRTFITSNWTKVSIRDGASVVANLELDDNKVRWTHEKELIQEYMRDEDGNIVRDGDGRPVFDYVEFESNQTLELTIVLKGSDVALPSTVSRSVILYGDKEVSSEEFQPFTFENTNDELTIKHKINVPAIA